MRASRWWSADPMPSISDVPQNPLPFNSARSRKVPGGRAVRWLRANLFASVTSSVISLLLITLLGKALVSLVQWGYWNAIWSVPGDQTGACRSIRGLGACWAVIPEKYRFILFGTYPFNEQWRPALVCLIFIALFYVSSRRSWWRKELVAVWAAALILIGVLFMASVMFPLFMPDGVNIDKLLRAQIAFVLYAGAYLAEVIRGGLQAVPRGQHDAADALGLSYWKKNGLIILPQAIRHVIPPLVNTFIAFFKDTSLVLIIGIFDLLTTAKTSIIDPAWQPFSIEVYVFVGVIYFVFC